MKFTFFKAVLLFISFQCFSQTLIFNAEDRIEEIIIDNYHLKDDKLYYRFAIRQNLDSLDNNVNIKFEKSYELSNKDYQQFLEALTSSNILSISSNLGGCLDCVPIKITGKAFGQLINISAYYTYLSSSDKKKVDAFYKIVNLIDKSNPHNQFIASLPNGKYSDYGIIVFNSFWKYNNEWMDMKDYPLVLFNDMEIAPNRVKEFEVHSDKYLIMRHEKNTPGILALYGTRAYNGLINMRTYEYHRNLNTKSKMQFK